MDLTVGKASQHHMKNSEFIIMSILKKLQVNSDTAFYTIKDTAGIEKKVTAVELIYGNPFEPNQLENDFFWNLEARMDKIDDQIINLYFGRSVEAEKVKPSG